MKIGILTYQYAMNYGALLQAYGLKTYLSSLNHEVEILNYDTSFLYNKQRPIKYRIISTVWNIVKNVLGARKKRKEFDIFRKDYLKLNDLILNSAHQLREYLKCKEFDAFIVGSDQVWNPEINGDDKTYFLDFADNQIKISYAASFGVSSLDDKTISSVIDCLQSFSAISVREKTAQKLLTQLDKKVEVVLDPVFLPERQVWDMLSGRNQVVDGKYLLCYVMPGDRHLEKRIEEIASEYKKVTGNKIIFLGRKEYKKFKPDGTDLVSAGPCEFVNLFKYADQIITNSFHGTAFSIIYNKPFYSLVNTQISGKKQLGSRVIDLLKELNIEERILDVNDSCDFTNKIDYECVDSCLNRLRTVSHNFIITALE